MIQLAGGELLSPAVFARSAPTAFLFGLLNSARTVGHLIAWRLQPPPVDSKFVGMTDYVEESFYDLLARDSAEVSNSGSRRGCHHPSHECFMADSSHHEETPKGRIESVNGGEVTPLLDPDDEASADERVLPNPWLEQI
jgi:hypothetical protein